MTGCPSPNAIRAWTSLVRTGQAVLSAVEADLRSEGFPPLVWYDALLELDREKGGPVRPHELEQRMLLAQYNVSRLVDRLAKAGYLEKCACPEDRRGTRLVITDEGRALLRRMWPAYARAIERHVGSRLDARSADTLAALLRRLSPEVRGE